MGSIAVNAAPHMIVDNAAKTATMCRLATLDTVVTPKERTARLTLGWLRENLDFDPTTGFFRWKKRGFGRTVGKIVGSDVRASGRNQYLMMKVDGEFFYAHRLAWFYHYGEWPSGWLDHIDSDRTNNAIANLRVATPSQNSARRETRRFKAPSRGVFPHGAGFVARIHHGGKRHYLGYFRTLAEARAVYEAKAKEIHGEFAYAEPQSDWYSDMLERVKQSPHRDWIVVATPSFGVH